MGMYVSFVRMTPQDLARAQQDPDWAEQYLEDLYDVDADGNDKPTPEDADVDIQKSWAGLDHLLDAAAVPFSIQEDGDCVANGDGWYLNCWTVEDVAHAAKVLRETPFDVLAAHFDAARLSREKVYPMGPCWDDDELDSLRDDYERLRAFFVAAAASGHGAMMSFG